MSYEHMPGPGFGRYLVERGEITRQQLDDAIGLMSEINLTMGEFAVRGGYIDYATAERINAMQRELDARWGEIAVAHGHLDEVTLRHLLDEQSRHNMNMGEALVVLGALSTQRRGELEAEFSRHEQTRRDAARLPAAFDQSATVADLLAVLPRMMLRLHRVQIELDLASARPDSSHPVLGPTATALWGTEHLWMGLDLDPSLSSQIVSSPSAEPTAAADPCVASLLTATAATVQGHFLPVPTFESTRKHATATATAARRRADLVVPIKSLVGDGRLLLTTPTRLELPARATGS